MLSINYYPVNGEKADQIEKTTGVFTICIEMINIYCRQELDQ